MTFNKYAFVFSNLGVMSSLKLMISRLISLKHYYVLNRSLASLPDEMKIRREISIRKINDQDIKKIIQIVKSLDPNSKVEVLSRILFYNYGFENCYIGITKEGEIAYLQWLVYPYENINIEKHFQNIFYPLRENQVMIENVFTFPKFRGLNLMPAITIRLLNIAKESGCKSAIMYVRNDRITAVNENVRLGFKITKMVTEYRFMGKIKRTL